MSDPDRNFFIIWWWLFVFSSCPARGNFFPWWVGTRERAGVTGKWIGITKEVANNKRLIHCGDQETDPDDAELELQISYAKKKGVQFWNVWLLAF